MKLRNTLFILTLIFIAENVYSQYGFSDRRDWKRNRKELAFSIGSTHFLGDLGGADQVGTQKSFKDLDFNQTRYNVKVGYRYRFHPWLATSTHLSYGVLSGDDNQTTELARNQRNLHFRSHFASIEQRLELIIWAKEVSYARRGLISLHPINLQLYGFLGLGAMWFQPQAKYKDDWVNLRPLHTEGQGMEGGPKEYLPFTATIPIGIGFKGAITPTIRLGVEIGLYKTFSNYIDDVGGNYYDAKAIGDAYGPIASYFSNPSPVPQNYPVGDVRGKADKDAYMAFNITVTKNVTQRVATGSKVRKYRGRTGY